MDNLDLKKVSLEVIQTSQEVIKNTTKNEWLHPLTRSNIIETMQMQIREAKKNLVYYRKFKNR